MPSLEPALQEKYATLQRVVKDLGSVVVAFSGGVDSTVVLKVAVDVLGPSAKAVIATSPTLPASELEEAHRLCASMGVHLEVVETDQLQIEAFVQNDARRCFHCKTDLYQLLSSIQRVAGFNAIVDGTNVDDMGEDRPGIQAGKQLGVRSPLLEAECTKSDVRQLAQALGLTNWNKPAAACLSSRITRGIPITKRLLSRVEQAEAFLLSEGLTQVRVRLHGEMARIEVGQSEIAMLTEGARRMRVLAALRQIGFRVVTLDLEGYRPGGGN
ncbi:MAG: ATP-dependent sacrificial sulfur transferase LarE [Nitrospirota bacterium]|nr:ATP-dependent sacrificial sulfur transferase LarE [Nitrospirota bacterium]